MFFKWLTLLVVKMDLGNPLIWITALAFFIFFKATGVVSVSPCRNKRKYNNAVDGRGVMCADLWWQGELQLSQHCHAKSLVLISSKRYRLNNLKQFFSPNFLMKGGQCRLAIIKQNSLHITSRNVSCLWVLRIHNVSELKFSFLYCK